MDDLNDTAGPGDTETSSDIPTPLELTARLQNCEARVTDLEEHNEQLASVPAADPLAAHRKTISRLEATADMLVGIVDNLVRHKGSIHDASHLDALELLLEEQKANRPESAQLFAGARAEIARRTSEANNARR